MLHNITKYYITDRRKCENTMRCTIMNNIKSAHELQMKTREASRGAWKDKAPDGQLLFQYAIAAQFWSPGYPPRSKL